jgi:hypothetical protein
MKTRNGTGYENTAVPPTRTRRVREARTEMDAAGTSTLETTTGESPPSASSPLSPLGSGDPLRELLTGNNDNDRLSNEDSELETDDSSTAGRSSENEAQAHPGQDNESSDRSRADADVASRGSANSDMQSVFRVLFRGIGLYPGGKPKMLALSLRQRPVAEYQKL